MDKHASIFGRVRLGIFSRKNNCSRNFLINMLEIYSSDWRSVFALNIGFYNPPINYKKGLNEKRKESNINVKYVFGEGLLPMPLKSLSRAVGLKEMVGTVGGGVLN